MAKQNTTPLITASASAPLDTQRTLETIAVIGLGYVGLPLAIRAAQQGFSIIGFDIDAHKIHAIQTRSVSYVSDAERSLLSQTTRFIATANTADLDTATTFIVCVPTPINHAYEPDLEPLKRACRTVSEHLKKGDLVVIESTVNPGVCDEIVRPILESKGLLIERDIFLAHCPERINPGDEHWNVARLPRVLGGAGPESLRRAKAVYEKIIDGTLMPMQSLQEAEAVKMVENAFRDINIAFVNELAMAFDAAHIDLMSVLRGASTKPFGFLPHYPGCGVGGHCIPVDPYYLIRFGEKNGFSHRFLRTARSINDRMPAYTVSLLTQALRRKRKKIKHTQVALLGLSYKRDIGDERESPAHEIRAQLLSRGALVRTYDPHVPSGSTHESIEAALEEADAAIIATDHTEFRSLTPFHFMRAGVNIVIDGRNCLRKDDFISSGILYTGIGRAGLPVWKQ